MCLCDLRYQGIWQADSPAREAELLLYKCTYGAQAPFCSKRRGHQNEFVALQCLSMVLTISTPFSEAFPSWNSPAFFFRLSGTGCTCEEGDDEAGPALADPSLSLLAMAGWWGGCRASLSSQSREDLLSSSEQFHGSRFLPGHHYHVSVLWLPYNARHKTHQRIIIDWSNTFCTMNMASVKSKVISNS